MSQNLVLVNICGSDATTILNNEYIRFSVLVMCFFLFSFRLSFLDFFFLFFLFFILIRLGFWIIMIHFSFNMFIVVSSKVTLNQTESAIKEENLSKL